MIGDDSVFTSTTLKTLIDGSSFKEIRSDTMSMSQGLSAMGVPRQFIQRKNWRALYLEICVPGIHTNHFCNHGLWPNCGIPGGIIPYPYPLYFHVITLSYWEWSFRRPYPLHRSILTTIYTSNKLVGLMYPIIVSSVCFVIGVLYITNKIDPDVND